MLTHALDARQEPGAVAPFGACGCIPAGCSPSNVLRRARLYRRTFHLTRTTARPAMPKTKMQTLDVRPLLANGDEPFALIRARVDALAPDESIMVIAPFLPSPLIEMLRGEGFESRVEHQPDGSWAVHFTRN